MQHKCDRQGNAWYENGNVHGARSQNPPSQLPEDEAGHGRPARRPGAAAICAVAAVLGQLLQQQPRDARLDAVEVERQAQEAVAVCIVDLPAREWGGGRGARHVVSGVKGALHTSRTCSRMQLLAAPIGTEPHLGRHHHRQQRLPQHRLVRHHLGQAPHEGALGLGGRQLGLQPAPQLARVLHSEALHRGRQRVGRAAVRAAVGPLRAGLQARAAAALQLSRFCQ
jgi:hypothetical protein